MVTGISKEQFAPSATTSFKEALPQLALCVRWASRPGKLHLV